jgi:hypothetical protein
MLDHFPSLSLLPPWTLHLLSPVKDGVHQTAQVFTPGKSTTGAICRTEYATLTTDLVPDDCSMQLNRTRSCACCIPGGIPLREITVQDNSLSLHQLKETKEALNAVCVTVSDTQPHWPANSADCNPIQHIRGLEMVRSSVNSATLARNRPPGAGGLGCYLDGVCQRDG